eukprot:5118685-Prymnesium_polylepis.1
MRACLATGAPSLSPAPCWSKVGGGRRDGREPMSYACPWRRVRRGERTRAFVRPVASPSHGVAGPREGDCVLVWACISA